MSHQGGVPAEHAVAELANGFPWSPTPRFAGVCDSGYDGTTGGSPMLELRTQTRGAIDEVDTDLVAHGHHGRQPPYDAC